MVDEFPSLLRHSTTPDRLPGVGTAVVVGLAVALLFGSAPASVYAQYSVSQTLTAQTVEQDGEFGRAVASVGDVNSDGTPDAVVSASGSCRANLISGTDGSVVHTLETKFCFGSDVDGAGDIDGDGTPDVIIGAEGHDETFLVSGADGNTIRTLAWPGSGGGLLGVQFGTAVAGIGDVDGDGTADVIVGANQENVNGTSAAGRAYVMSGADGSVLQTLESPNPTKNGNFGDAVAGVGDINEDSTPDVVVGATNEHSAYLISGADGSMIETMGADTYSGFFGEAVAGIDDVNGDNTPDVLIGASGEDAGGADQAGRVYLISGADGSTIRTVRSPNATDRGDFGHSVAAINDANDDGTPDVLVGARRENVNGTTGAGRAYVFSSANGYVLGTLSSQNVEQNTEFGYDVAGIDDLGNGGPPEVIVGARKETVGGTSVAGRAYVFSADSPLSGTPLPSISSPSGLTATTADDPAAELSWDAVGSSKLDEYRIYRATSPITGSPSGLSPIGSVGSSTTSYTDGDGTAGTEYYYRVTAATATGDESDFSNEVDVFLYPQTIPTNVSRSFGGATDSTGYRLVALPGGGGQSIADAVSGEAGAEWQAYLDDGSESNFLQKYDGSDAFTFEPGGGFWLTATSDWSFTESVSTVALRGDTATTIPLREGWNVISNPLGTDVSWTDVETATNANLQPIWAFDGTFTSSTTFASAASGSAYYFFNESARLDSLVIPYPGPSSKRTSRAAAPPEASPMLVLSAEQAHEEETAASTVRIGLVDTPGQTRSIVAPPGRFEDVSLRITSQKAVERPSRQQFLMAARRISEGTGQTFDLRLRNRSKGPVEVSASNLDALQGREVRLLTPSTGQSYDLTETQRVTLPSRVKGGNLKLAVGTEAYVGEKAGAVVPEKLALTTYPNPVRERGTLEYALPDAKEVTLRVYDVLGREVATLVDGQKKAGRHTVRLSTDRLTSGIYFGRLTAGERRRTQKITVVR